MMTTIRTAGWSLGAAMLALALVSLPLWAQTSATIMFAEDAVHTSGDLGFLGLAVRKDTAGTLAGTDGDYAPLQLSAAGNLRMELAAIASGVGTTTDTDDGSVAGAQAGAALVVALRYGFDGTNWLREVAHDAVDVASAPYKMGMRAIAHGTNPTAVAAADMTHLYANRAGVPFVIGGHPNIVTLETAHTAAETNLALVTVGAGTKIVVTNVAFVCDNANTVDVGVRIGFAAVTTPTTTGVVLTHPGIPAGSGYNRGSGAGILGVGADGEDLRITSEVPTTGSCRSLVSYYTIES